MKEPFKITLIDHEWENTNIENSLILNEGSKKSVVEFNILQTREKTEIIKGIQDSDAIIVMYATIDAEIINQMDKLKIISRYGMGVNNIDVEKATEKGIIVANVGDYCIEEVSNHALSMILASNRHLLTFNQLVKDQKWDFKLVNTPVRTSKLIVGLIGFGQIAKKLAKKLAIIGFNVQAYDPFIEQTEMDAHQVKKVTLDELLKTSDYVSIHSPLIDNTYHLLDRMSFDKMKKTAIIINTSRGPLINEADLLEALKMGMIAGACLDVLEHEPIRRNHPFIEMDNVIITPHVAWYSEDAVNEIRSKAVMNVMDFYHGKVPKYVVNKELIGRR